MNATGEWFNLKKVWPIPGRSYLIATKSVGINCDVAYFQGVRPGGSLWWVMTNCEIPFDTVTHFAAINLPEKE